tara:strand:+ start:2397 stop:3467 length:1071 start_codon:yes stop_codon:yes gene_type:complete
MKTIKINKLKYLLILTTLLLGLLNGYAQNTDSGQYASLAIDKLDGERYGWAINYETKSLAEKRALQECKKKGGNCFIVLTFRGGCGAYVTERGNSSLYGWAKANNLEDAKRLARQEARKRGGTNLVNRVWGCNTGPLMEVENKEVAGSVKYDKEYPYTDGFAIVMNNDKYGFINTERKVVIPIKYDDAWNFKDGLATVDVKGKKGRINKKGKIIIPIKYDGIGAFKGGLAMVIINEKYGFINKTGKTIIPTKYEAVWDFIEGLAAVSLNGKKGRYNKRGEIIIPVKYDAIDVFKEGIARVAINNKWGFIDKTGKIIAPISYDSADSFGEMRAGLALVSKDGKYFYINKEGKYVRDL